MITFEYETGEISVSHLWYPDAGSDESGPGLGTMQTGLAQHVARAHRRQQIGH